MDHWAETDLAWELVDGISPLLADRDRAELYAILGSGQSYMAIEMALGIIAGQGVPLAGGVVAKLGDFCDGYARSEDGLRLRDLLTGIIESLRP